MLLNLYNGTRARVNITRKKQQKINNYALAR